jgi:hypothetical protein
MGMIIHGHVNKVCCLDEFSVNDAACVVNVDIPAFDTIETVRTAKVFMARGEQPT